MNPPLQEKNDIRKPMNLLRVELKCVKRGKTQCRPIHFPFVFRYCEKGVKKQVAKFVATPSFYKKPSVVSNPLQKKFFKNGQKRGLFDELNIKVL